MMANNLSHIFELFRRYLNPHQKEEFNCMLTKHKVPRRQVGTQKLVLLTLNYFTTNLP